jgi:hypothetical protein
MAPLKALYGRRCRTPLNWVEPGERTIFVPYLIMEAEEIVHRIQSNVKATRAQQESYANKRRQPLEFEAGNRVYLTHLRCEEIWDQKQAGTTLHKPFSCLGSWGM